MRGLFRTLAGKSEVAKETHSTLQQLPLEMGTFLISYTGRTRGFRRGRGNEECPHF